MTATSVTDGSNGAAERRAALVASRLAPWLIELFHNPDGASVPPSLKLDAAGKESVALETLGTLTDDPGLKALLHGPTRKARDVEARLLELMRERQVEVRSADLLWATLAGEWPVETGATPAAAVRRGPFARHRRGLARWLRRSMAAAALSAVIASVLFVTQRYAATWAWPGTLTLLEVFVVATLSFFPVWLFVRFIGFRAGAVWDEYVLNLHRLSVDEPQHLPRPPINSVYYAGWVAAGGPLLARQPTIYQQKFDAYYGRSVSRAGDGAVKIEALFPLFLFTAVVATGWTAVLSQPDVITGAGAPPTYSTLDVMAFAFMGAYAFTVQMLVRRYFQADLKASAYAGSFARITVAVGSVAVLHRAGLLGEGTVQAAVAFVIGSFPLMGLQLLHRAAGKVAKIAVPALDFPHPLSDLEGLSIWYEARLLEEGIEDMQNLLTANVPEVILHTRVPVGRLVDWIDQAHLFLRLPPMAKDDRKKPMESQHPRCALRRIGVRTASGFLDAFPLDPGGWQLQPGGAMSVTAVESLGMTGEQLSTISRILEAEPSMESVWRWRCWKSCLPAADGISTSRQHIHRNTTPPADPST
ncbi:MAG TPA: hypothetical protein VM938_15315 [Acidimicrobiales bacterium]|nr:hypothetical protein [Acidimicrobiales bacterium]